MTNSKPFDEYLIEKLADPAYAKVYLEAALESYEVDRDSDAFLLALRDVVGARGD